MSAGITVAEALDMPRGQRIRTSRCENIQRFLEWHGFHMETVHGGRVTYRRDNRSGVYAAPEPSDPGVIPVY